MSLIRTASINMEKNVIGSGLIATAFLTSSKMFARTCIYAAGVSNSNCINPIEFERERSCLTEALQKNAQSDAFVYFSTCSIADPALSNSAYVTHKIAMEELVAKHSHYIIIRLPQVAGNTSNPHTLLNYFYNKISQNQPFSVWKNAMRNIIDVDDVVVIVNEIINSPWRKMIVNVANPISLPVVDIVSTMEKVLRKQAQANIIDKHSTYKIDTHFINNIINKIGLSFDETYIFKVIEKYYGRR